MDFAFAIMVASLPALYRPLDTAFNRIRKLIRLRIPNFWRGRGSSCKSSVRRLVSHKPYCAPSSFHELRTKNDAEGRKDILLSSPSHMSGYHQAAQMEGQPTVMACDRRSEDAETASEEGL